MLKANPIRRVADDGVALEQAGGEQFKAVAPVEDGPTAGQDAFFKVHIHFVLSYIINSP
jgi:hypothetical protein